MSTFLVAVAVLSVALAFGLRREFARLEREAAWRRVMQSDAVRKIARDFERVKVQIGAAMLPSLTEATRALVAMQSQIQALGDAATKAKEKP